MTATVTRMNERGEAPLTRARRLRDESLDAALSAAEMLSNEAAVLAARCGEASQIDSFPAGIRDALKKLGMELESRNQSLKAIMGTGR